MSTIAKNTTTKTIRDTSIYHAIEDVQSLTTIGLKKGRENILKYFHTAGIDHDQLKVFHVAGTNGKGSVCHMIAQTLHGSFGFRVWLFTSPHLVDISERFQVDGEKIDHAHLDSLYKQIIQNASKWSIELSFFEIQVITAVIYFLSEDVDYAVFEVGMWGTYDGTNIWTKPIATYVTSISLEHTNVLGKTWTTILKNKIGIAKNKTPLFTPYDNKIIERHCRQIWATHISIKNIYKKKDYPRPLTNLAGSHQERNALLVYTSLIYLGFKEDTVLEGLSRAYVPGRLEYIRPNILVDTANNTQSIRSVLRTLGADFFRQEVILLFGSTQTDAEYIADIANMFPTSQKYLVDWFHRAHDVRNYRDKVDGYKKSYSRVPEALEDLASRDTKILISGSLYLVGEAIKFFQSKK